MDDSGHLLRLPGALHWNALDHIRHLGRCQLNQHFCTDDCGRDCIDANAFGGNLLCNRLGEADDRCWIVVPTLDKTKDRDI
jgi:hypothetical protein